jgi:hypothetical protein
VRVFTADKWFTSLWTLQEVFLSPKAQLIFLNANKNSFDLCNLKNISELFIIILEGLGFDDKIRKLEKEQGFNLHLDNSGFLDGVQANAMSLLRASHNRITTCEEDRVYEIMQVFHLQLGKSSPAAVRRDYSLAELTDELGAAPLVQHPIVSQLHVHKKAVTRNKAWRFSESSIVPEHAKLFDRHMRSQVKKKCLQSYR